MVDTGKDTRLDDILLALEQDKIKAAVSMLRQMFAQPANCKERDERVAQVAEKVADACIRHDECQDAAAIYRLLLCADCGVYHWPSEAGSATRSKLLHALVDLGHATPTSVRAD